MDRMALTLTTLVFDNGTFRIISMVAVDITISYHGLQLISETFSVSQIMILTIAGGTISSLMWYFVNLSNESESSLPPTDAGMEKK